MMHYLESKVDLSRRLRELCPLEAQKHGSLREIELIHSFKEGLFIGSSAECPATRVFRTLSQRSAELDRPQLTVAELQTIVVDIEHHENLLNVKRTASLQARYRAVTEIMSSEDVRKRPWLRM